MDFKIYWGYSVNSFIFSLLGSILEGVLKVKDIVL